MIKINEPCSARAYYQTEDQIIVHKADGTGVEHVHIVAVKMEIGETEFFGFKDEASAQSFVADAIKTPGVVDALIGEPLRP